MESRALLAFALSLAILIGYQMMFGPERPMSPEGGAAQISGGDPLIIEEDVSDVSGAPRPSAAAGAEAYSSAALPARGDEKLTTVETDLYRAVLSSSGGRIQSFLLKNYEHDVESDTDGREMVSADRLRPLGMYWADAAGTEESMA